MTDSKVQEIFNMAVQICEDNGYKPVKLVPKCGYTTRQNVFGICAERRYKYTKEVVYTQVKVNKKFAEKANEQQMLNTLLHECLHAIYETLRRILKNLLTSKRKYVIL